MLTYFNNIWWRCSWGNLQQTPRFLSLHSKTCAQILCTIKRKSLLRNYVTRRTENDVTQRSIQISA